MYILSDMEKQEVNRIKVQSNSPQEMIGMLIGFAREIKGAVASACPFCERKEAVLKEANIL